MLFIYVSVIISLLLVNHTILINKLYHLLLLHLTLKLLLQIKDINDLLINNSLYKKL